MANYRLSEEAKEDLIRIHQFGVERFGVERFGVKQADKYFDAFFDNFELISKNPFLFEPVDYLRKGYPRCPCGSDSIYFRLSEDVVEIMAIIGRQDVDSKL